MTAPKYTLRFWGARGTVPSPAAEKLRYGGNTSCLALALDDREHLILDCGSGVRHCGMALPPNPDKRPIRFHILDSGLSMASRAALEAEFASPTVHFAWLTPSRKWMELARKDIGRRLIYDETLSIPETVSPMLQRVLYLDVDLCFVDPVEELIAILMIQLSSYRHLNIRQDVGTLAIQSIIEPKSSGRQKIRGYTPIPAGAVFD